MHKERPYINIIHWPAVLDYHELDLCCLGTRSWISWAAVLACGWWQVYRYAIPHCSIW